MPGAAGTRAGRRPATAPPTQPAILAAARDLFARRGFAATSIRAIAEQAEVDPALVHHYFGTKEGLFRAALQIPIDPDQLVRQVVASDPQDLASALVRMFLQVWDGPETGPAMVGFLRRALSEQGDLDLVRDFIGTSVLRDVAATLLRDLDPHEARIRTSLALSQLLGVVVARAILCIEPVASLPAADLAATIAPTIDRYLHGELPVATSAGRPPETKRSTT